MSRSRILHDVRRRKRVWQACRDNQVEERGSWKQAPDDERREQQPGLLVCLRLLLLLLLLLLPLLRFVSPNGLSVVKFSI